MKRLSLSVLIPKLAPVDKPFCPTGDFSSTALLTDRDISSPGSYPRSWRMVSAVEPEQLLGAQVNPCRTEREMGKLESKAEAGARLFA
jgi:hypothetical protein